MTKQNKKIIISLTKKISLTLLFKPLSFVEMVRGKVFLHVQIYNIVSGFSHFLLFKVYLFSIVYIWAGTRGEVAASAAAAWLYFAK